MRNGGLFGSGAGPGEVTLVEASESRRYRRLARVAFYGCTVTGGLVGAVVTAGRPHPLVAVVVGALAGAVAGLVVGVLVVAWPVLRTVWHWSAEITLTAGLLAGLDALARATSGLAAVGALAAVVVPLAAVGPVRRRLVAVWWCGVVRHRLRLCFVEFIRAAGPVRYQAGRRPLILWARPTPAGERVWVWLRPGLSLEDLDGKTDRIAVACWAGEARVVRASARYAALVRVDVTRRDPLTGKVASPLPGLLGEHARTAAPVSPGMPPVGLDLDDIPEPAEDELSPRRRNGGR